MKRFIAFVVTLISVFSLVGCSQAVGPGRPIIGDYVTTVYITHQKEGKSTQWVAKSDEVDRLRSWASELEYKRFEFEDGQSPGDSDGEEVYDFILTKGDYPEFSYVINGTDDCYLLIDGNWHAVSNPSNPPVMEPQGERLTLEKVKELAQKGEDLSWSDFAQYKDMGDIGSGLYILAYDIDENYYLLIGGGNKDMPPMYIYLYSKVDDSVFIDIRTENIDEFINKISA